MHPFLVLWILSLEGGFGQVPFKNGMTSSRTVAPFLLVSADFVYGICMGTGVGVNKVTFMIYLRVFKAFGLKVIIRLPAITIC